MKHTSRFIFVAAVLVMAAILVLPVSAARLPSATVFQSPTVAPTVPADVCAVVDLALAFSRDARYPDARTMLGDVRALKAAERPPFVTGDPAVLGRDDPAPTV